MNKKGLVDALSAKLTVSKKDLTLLVESVFDTIAETLEKEEAVDISGFGKFEVKERAARVGINPATKEKVKYEASNYVKFKAAKALKEGVKK